MQGNWQQLAGAAGELQYGAVAKLQVPHDPVAAAPAPAGSAVAPALAANAPTAAGSATGASEALIART